MKVYRIVDSEGYGLYRHLAKRIGMPMVSTYSHPISWEDLRLVHDRAVKNLEQDVRYCFISLLQLKRWMYNYQWIEDCIAEKAVLQVFEVEEEFVGIGTTQAVFAQGKAKLIKKLSLDFLLQD